MVSGSRNIYISSREVVHIPFAFRSYESGRVTQPIGGDVVTGTAFLPLCARPCVSTAFVPKTVPFLALLPQEQCLRLVSPTAFVRLRQCLSLRSGASGDGHP